MTRSPGWLHGQREERAFFLLAAKAIHDPRRSP